MKKTLDEHAERFSAAAGSYDEDGTPEYEACAGLVVERAAPEPTETVVDLGCGTGAIALALADRAKRVVGRDISDGMVERAREKAAQAGLENVEFGYGEFRNPEYDGDADVVVSNFALHHLSEAEKREAIGVMASLGRDGDGPRRIVLGDVMFFGAPDPDVPFYSPEVDDPSTVGSLVEMFTSVGYAVTKVDRVHDQVGVVTAERLDAAEHGA